MWCLIDTGYPQKSTADMFLNMDKSLSDNMKTDNTYSALQLIQSADPVSKLSPYIHT